MKSFPIQLILLSLMLGIFITACDETRRYEVRWSENGGWDVMFWSEDGSTKNLFFEGNYLVLTSEDVGIGTILIQDTSRLPLTFTVPAKGFQATLYTNGMLCVIDTETGKTVCCINAGNCKGMYLKYKKEAQTPYVLISFDESCQI